MSAWRALLAGLLVVGLGGALVLVVVRDSRPGEAIPTLVTTSSTIAPDTTVAVTVAAPPSTTDAPSSVVTSTVASVPPVVVAMQDALTAWGEFAVTGRMRDLGDGFVVGGPQRRLLRAESATILEDPLGPPPYVVTTDNIFTVSVTPTDVVLRAEIQWAREGEETQRFVWDIQMQLNEGLWRLLTVEDVAPG